MIVLRPLRFRDRLLEAVFPWRRRERERRVDEAMRLLMADLEEPCVIEDWLRNGWLLSDGKGTTPRRLW